MDSKFKIPYLNNHDIFSYLANGCRIIYAPLSGIVAEATEEEILDLEAQAKSGQFGEILSALCDNDSKIFLSQTPYEIKELTILLNQICNFSCSYCYSANGREKIALDLERIHSLLDKFIVKRRGTNLQIVFSGGGDPVLSFSTFMNAVTYAEQLAEREGIAVDISIVTNGSTLTEEYVSFIQRYNIGLVVSFDILKDVHNRQRSHYDVVASTIDYLCSKNVSFGIRSTITPLNVCRQEEMVTELHNRFPEVKSAAFEAVLNKNLFSSPEDLNKFYDDFETNIFRAVSKGKELGLCIGNTIINNIDCCKERACLGKLVATPYGKLTACSRLSSDKEDNFDKFVYGSVENGEINIDNIKYSKIIGYNNISDPMCNSCIAKWHCSGGCLLARYSLPDEYFKANCRFMRNMTMHVLLDKIKEQDDEMV